MGLLDRDCVWVRSPSCSRNLSTCFPSFQFEEGEEGEEEVRQAAPAAAFPRAAGRRAAGACAARCRLEACSCSAGPGESQRRRVWILTPRLVRLRKHILENTYITNPIYFQHYVYFRLV